MADSTIKPDSGNDLVLQNNGGTGKIEINDGAEVKVTTGSSSGDDFIINTTQLVVEGDNGNVGIGLSDPDELLHLSSTTTAEPVLQLEQNTNDATSAEIKFINAQGGGNAGVAGHDLGRITFTGNLSNGNQLKYAEIYSEITDPHATTGKDGKIGFKVNCLSTDTEVMTIIPGADAEGHVGIGQTSPSGNNTLTLNGPSYHHLQLQVSGSDTGYMCTDGSYMYIGHTAGVALRTGGGSSVGGTDRLAINSSGNVGIGITPSNVRLYVQGSTTDSSNYAIFLMNSGGANLMYVRNDGYTWAYQSWATSDRRKKKNITYINDDILPKIEKLKLAKFDYIDVDSKDNYGFIAQDVEEIFPDCISDTEIDAILYQDGDEIPEGKEIGDIKKEKDEQKNLNYNFLFSHLVKAVQELSAKVSTLENA